MACRGLLGSLLRGEGPLGAPALLIILVLILIASTLGVQDLSRTVQDGCIHCLGRSKAASNMRDTYSKTARYIICTA
eukprot:1463070-Pyramimonas_sp.AAC.1